jgi:hypothetical protein
MQAIRRKLGTLRADIHANGYASAFRKLEDRSLVWCLSRLFGFPSAWHPPTSARPYRTLVANQINLLKPRVVCEVGCGLGSILGRVRAERRVGIDISPGVIRAARLIRSREIEFRVGSLKDVDLPAIDVLVLVNWIHEVSPEELEMRVVPLLPSVRYLLLDAIDPENPFGYRYKHDFAFLRDRAELASVAKQAEEGRSFRLFEIKR